MRTLQKLFLFFSRDIHRKAPYSGTQQRVRRG